MVSYDEPMSKAAIAIDRRDAYRSVQPPSFIFKASMRDAEQAKAFAFVGRIIGIECFPTAVALDQHLLVAGYTSSNVLSTLDLNTYLQAALIASITAHLSAAVGNLSTYDA
jgi:hypothetical protein